MTLIASWVATDDKPIGKKISAVYFCSDSRFSWTVCGKVFDMGKKVYACRQYPEIFCFCGDVDFPTTSLQSLIIEIDNGLLFDDEAAFVQKKIIVADFFNQALSQYPKEVLAQHFVIYYASCISQEFFMAEYRYDGSVIVMKDLALPSESSIVFADGSGKKLFDKMWSKANKETVNERNTSRNVYNCFTRTLDEAANHPEDADLKLVGGSPQLVGLYRQGETQIYGIVRNNDRYIQGRKVVYNPNLSRIEWRNDSFERINPETLKLLTGAQPQPFAPRE